MGNRRMGLGRMEALLEQVDRELNLVNSTLLNCTITTSALATFSGGVDLGGGLAPANSVGAICNALAISADGYGMYEVLFETDLGGYTATATDNGLIKTAITIPTDSMVIGGSAMVTEVVGQNNTSTIDLVSATTALTDTADEATTAVLTLIDGADFKSSSLGALGAFLPMVYANSTVHHIGTTGTSTTLAWINKGTGNGTSAYLSGKIMVYLKYLGSGPAVADTRV
jgi:hypothetical protein